MNEVDERNWTPPDPERKQQLLEQYQEEGHLCWMDANYTTAESVAAAEANGWPSAHKETAPADEYRPSCSCYAYGEAVSDWREARRWIRDHRAEHGLDRQVFISELREVEPHLRGHEVFIGLDTVARDQGDGGWFALCACEDLNEEEGGYLASYADAVASAADHAAKNEGFWEEGHPATEEEYERIA